jgi:deoxyribodipyrimidine photo-lyase
MAAKNDSTTVICWLRRELRLQDNLALHAAIATRKPVAVVYIFDPKILSSNRIAPARVAFMLQAMKALDEELKELGTHLLMRKGDPNKVLPQLASDLNADTVFFNLDYTPYARKRDDAVQKALKAKDVEVQTFHDRLLVAPEDIATGEGKPYSVYTPFKNKWREIVQRGDVEPHDYKLAKVEWTSLRGVNHIDLPSAKDLGIAESDVPLPEASAKAARKQLSEFIDFKIYTYKEDRNLLSNPDDERNGTSFMSPYIRWGLISLRQIREACLEAYNQTDKTAAKDSVTGYMNEIVWHEFYIHVLWHYPQVKTENYSGQYNRVVWRDAPDDLEAWKQGMTGYPVVDAAMRQLNTIGWMHNRARMITASFLTKDLLIDWREGELYFMQCLLDGDLAENNGGWQWAAGTGTDAQPYFRIFNPVSQSEKFDPDGKFIRDWIPELKDVPDKYIHAPWEMPEPPKDYPKPIVEHKAARERALDAFKNTKS